MSARVTRFLFVAMLITLACGWSGGPLVPELQLSTHLLTFSAPEGGPSPAEKTLTLKNTGQAGSQLVWTASVSEPWLSVTPASGSERKGKPRTLRVAVNSNVQTEAWTQTMSTDGAPDRGWGAWTGSALLIWPGDPAVPARFYDPVSNSWFGAATTIGAPSTRTLFSAVWTGTEMIVWGGVTEWDGAPLNTGARYDPGTDAWTPMSTIGAPAARFAHRAVWTGTRMIVWGGEQGNYSYFGDGAVYDPATDSWTPMSQVNAPEARAYFAACWTGSRMLIWGGSNPSLLPTGAFYDPVADVWSGSPTTVGAPQARTHMEAVWTGREVILWGGGSFGPHFNSGARYNPAIDRWTGETTLVGAPDPKASHVMAWTGSHMIVWGGESNGPLVNTGALYRPLKPAEGPHTATITISAPGAVNAPQIVQVNLTVTP